MSRPRTGCLRRPPHPRRPLRALLLAAACGAAVAGAAGTSGCTDAGIYDASGEVRLADKLTIGGSTCTDDPATLGLPVRVLFLVDASRALDRLDPQALRVEAIQRVLHRFGTLPNYSFALLQLADGPRNLVGSFTSDQAALLETGEQLRATQPCGATGCRDLNGALSLAGAVIGGDILGSSPGARSSTRYVVLLLLAGRPDELPPETCPGARRWDCTNAALVQRVRALRDGALAQGAAGLTFHATLLVDGEDTRDGQRQAGQLVEQLAAAGLGSTLTFPDAASVSFDSLALGSAETVYLKKSLVVANLNARVLDGRLVADSDGDGLADEEERRLGTDPGRTDSDGDDLGDLVELHLGLPFDPLTPDAPPPCTRVEPGVDTDGDGLGDCAELLLGSAPSVVDSDADGLPDGLEFSWGTNLLADDRLGDLDLDGEENGREVLVHTDPLADDREARWALAYRYDEQDGGIRRVPYCSQPRAITGVGVVGASALSTAGVGQLAFTSGEPPTLAWTDPDPYAPMPGDAVALRRDGVHVLAAHDPRRSISVEVVRSLLPLEPVREALVVGSSDRNCFSFRIKNISLVETLAPPLPGGERGANRILVYFSQVPREAPRSGGIFRVAELRVRHIAPDFRYPDLAELHLDERDFVLLGR